MDHHVLVELSDCVIVRPGSNVQHESVVWLEVLADSLEEPLVRVDLAIVPLLDRHNEVDPPSFKGVRGQAEVPGAHLEHVKDVLGHILDALVHELVHFFHLPVAFSVLGHEAFLLEHLDVKHLVLSSIFLERFWNLVEAIGDQDHDHVSLSHFDVGVHVHGVVVLEDSSHCGFELGLVFVIHRDANSQFRVAVSDEVQLFHAADQAGVLELSILSVLAESTWSHCGVELGARQAHRFVRDVLGWLPA